MEAVSRSRYLKLAPPSGAMYAFIGVERGDLPEFDDQQFALDLLEHKHVLVAPGVSFNVPYRTHFRVTTLPDAAQLKVVFTRIEELLASYATRPGTTASANVVSAQDRFVKT
jgi:alanine-synthesizing transaminase